MGGFQEPIPEAYLRIIDTGHEPGNVGIEDHLKSTAHEGHVDDVDTRG
jgi:hypothetical protein